MKTRLYRRKSTVAAAIMVKEMVTPRTAAGSACPERPILVIVADRVVLRQSKKVEGVVAKCSCDNKVAVEVQVPTTSGRDSGSVCWLGTQSHRV